MYVRDILLYPARLILQADAQRKDILFFFFSLSHIGIVLFIMYRELFSVFALVVSTERLCWLFLMIVCIASRLPSLIIEIRFYADRLMSCDDAA